MTWKRPLRTAALLFSVLFLVTGVIYPLLVTGITGLVFPYQAQGSLVRDGSGAVTGSELIGLPFSGPYYFEGRPSTTLGLPHQSAQSGGSNLGPSNPALLGRVNASIQHLERLGMEGPWPGDLVTSSGSGLDPHISVDAALLQVPAVAKARGMDEETVRSIVYRNIIADPLFWEYGYVNVFALNRALDQWGVP